MVLSTDWFVSSALVTRLCLIVVVLPGICWSRCHSWGVTAPSFACSKTKIRLKLSSAMWCCDVIGWHLPLVDSTDTALLKCESARLPPREQTECGGDRDCGGTFECRLRGSHRKWEDESDGGTEMPVCCCSAAGCDGTRRALPFVFPFSCDHFEFVYCFFSLHNTDSGETTWHFACPLHRLLLAPHLFRAS